MEYIFYAITTTGAVISGTANFGYDNLGDCPFGMVPYRERGSCDVDPPVLDAFWDCIDEVLLQNEMTGADFGRAVKATSPAGDVGEVGFNPEN